jgi:hypothetical protein
MPRRFVRASSSVITQPLTAPGFAGMTFGTAAAVVNRTVSGTNQYAVLGVADNASDNSLVLYFQSSNVLNMYWAGNDNLSSATVTSTDGWVLIAGTKATGSVAPRLHIYKWATNVWTHQNGASNRANASLFGSTLWIGNDTTTFNSFYEGDIAAVMLVDKRAMSDGEIERLPNGLWERWATGPTDLLREFGPRDQPIAGRNIDPSLRRDTSTAGTTRTPIAGPPGFRYSAVNRRR